MLLRVSFWLPLLLSLLAALAARAESALLASSTPRAAELAPELALALRGHGILLLSRPLGAGRTPLERAAAAQRGARNAAASAVLWIEPEPPVRLRAVAVTGERLVEAPLPESLEQIDARLFAEVGTSLLLEALGRAVSPGARVPQGPEQPAWTTLHVPSQRVAGRVFARAGVGAGLVLLRAGTKPDRLPSTAVVDQIATSSGRGGAIDVALAAVALREQGYRCQVSTTSEGALSVSECTVAVDPAGIGRSLMFDFALGAQLTRWFALALTARAAPRAGFGPLAHAVLGLEGEWLLTAPRARGPWLQLLLGAGFGRIQARPPNQGADGPFGQGGPGNVRVGVPFGYRFHERVGCYASPVLHVMFPDRLYAIDVAFGLEARL